jgi:chromosome segregation ATPase
MGIEMTDTEKKKFKIDLSTPLSDELAADMPPVEETAVGAPTQRPLWWIFITILVIGAAFIWGYHDLRNKLHAVDTTGSTEISGLSTQINETIENLAAQISDGDTALQNDLSHLETQLKKADSAIGDMRTRKAERSELKTVSDRITAAVEALKKDIESIQKQIDLLSSRMEVAQIQNDTVQSAVEKNQQRIETLATQSIDNDRLNAALTAERDYTQQNMAHAAETLYSEIATLQKAVRDLQLRVDAAAKSAAVKSEPMTREKSKTPQESVGGIIEQEIK